MADKSDKKAKEEFCKFLKQKGYENIAIIKNPADIIAFMDDKKFFFEIKKTSKEESYFGAATLTEWKAAYDNPGRYKFVIAQESKGGFNFVEYTPKEFEKFSTIPPFKIYFNVALEGEKKAISKRKRRDSVPLSEKKIIELDKLYKKFKTK